MYRQPGFDNTLIISGPWKNKDSTCPRSEIWRRRRSVA